MVETIFETYSALNYIQVLLSHQAWNQQKKKAPNSHQVILNPLWKKVSRTQSYATHFGKGD